MDSISKALNNQDTIHRLHESQEDGRPKFRCFSSSKNGNKVQDQREMQIKATLTHQSEWLRSKSQEKTGAGKDVEKEEHSSTAGGVSSWYYHSGSQSNDSSENW